MEKKITEMSDEEKIIYCAENFDKQVAPSAQALSSAFQDEEYRKNNSKLIESFCSGEAANINPLEILKPQMKLYGFSGAFMSEFFDSEEQLAEWMKSNDTSFGSRCVIEYLGNVAGRSDVIRITDESGRTDLYTVVDEDGYGIYNNKRSICLGKYVWEFSHGSISEFYSAFRDRGISFEHDIYDEIDRKHQQILKYSKDNKLFNHEN